MLSPYTTLDRRNKCALHHWSCCLSVHCTIYLFIYVSICGTHFSERQTMFHCCCFSGCYYVVSSGCCWCRWFVSRFFLLRPFLCALSHFTSQSLRTNYPREMEAKIADATQMLSKKCKTTFSPLHSANMLLSRTAHQVCGGRLEDQQ